jgi:hypothetical protein
MRARFTAALLAVIIAALVVVAAAAGAMVGIYRNGMQTSAQRGQMIKLTGRNCSRAGIEQALQITLGKHTSQCTYRTPVVGRELEISASERLLSSTPKGLQRKVYLGLILRTGAGAGYQLAVYPAQQKVQLRKNLPGGKVKYLAITRAQKTVAGINRTNELSLQAVDITSGPERGQCRLFAFAGGKLVAEAIDSAAHELHGGASGVAIGAGVNATGAIASVDNVVVRVPSPF